MSKNFDLSTYFVIGPENTKGRPVLPIIHGVIEAGFTFIQIRSKVLSTLELINLTKETSELIKKLGKQNEVSLVVNDRLDVVLAAREMGVKVDGIHVGQDDIPVDICRKYLGEDAIIGLSSKYLNTLEFVEKTDHSNIDYYGIGPLHETPSKTDITRDVDGNIHSLSYSEISKIVKASPLPCTIGGGVKFEQLKELKDTGIESFFVISAIASAYDPKLEAKKMVDAWRGV